MDHVSQRDSGHISFDIERTVSPRGKAADGLVKR